MLRCPGCTRIEKIHFGGKKISSVLTQTANIWVTGGHERSSFYFIWKKTLPRFPLVTRPSGLMT
jgi:hypothetical protein